MEKIFHKDDVKLLFDKLTLAKKTRKTVIFDIRIVDFNKLDNEYNYFHIGVKLINTNNQSDIFVITFEKL